MVLKLETKKKSDKNLDSLGCSQLKIIHIESHFLAHKEPLHEDSEDIITLFTRAMGLLLSFRIVHFSNERLDNGTHEKNGNTKIIPKHIKKIGKRIYNNTFGDFNQYILLNNYYF